MPSAYSICLVRVILCFLAHQIGYSVVLSHIPVPAPGKDGIRTGRTSIRDISVMLKWRQPVASLFLDACSRFSNFQIRRLELSMKKNPLIVRSVIRDYN